jgi:thiosulfate/3-mercaptopyruvate sulfurtransferase
MTSLTTTTDVVISVRELREAQAAGKDVVLLDIRRTADAALRDEYESGHLPGAHFVNHFTQLAGERTASSGKNPLPSEETIQDAATSWGINPDSLVVVYGGGNGGPTAARGWWVLKWAGVPDVRYLDGGLDAWLAAGGELSSEEPPRGGGTLEVSLGSLPVLSPELAAARARDGVLLDARYRADYVGDATQTGMGHIPGALSAPFHIALGEDGLLLDNDAIREQYAILGADGSQPIGIYCGGGVGATIGILALHRLGISAELYPGSWTQWSSDPSRPVSTGTDPG